jgi:two-component system, sensor histidine kinase and response regulator
MNKQVIICVDDELIVLDALKEQLQKEFRDEFLIEVAESGDEALEVFEEYIEDGYQVPLVLADFIMPNMKGDDFLVAIHARDADTKKIMLTGQATIEGVGKAVNQANLYRYVPKPWDKADLFLTIREAIKSYNQAKTILKQNIELKELNSGLEEKVEIRTRELAELNHTKDKFFSIIAHDLKNPFNSLLGFSELLLENMEIYTTAQIKEYVSIIFETAGSSYLLLENLLEWSRSQTGSISVDKKIIDLSSLAADNIKQQENHAVTKGIQLCNNISPGITAYADYNMINTVIRNLLSNAVKYTKRDGSITIDCEKLGDKLKVYVSDTGVGMIPDRVEKLFRIDQNVSTKGTDDETGTGLGLILCKEFIEKNGGEIWVESLFEKGSTFSFTLDIKENK